MSNPRVSICIPTYNRADMVGLAIESALNQSYRDIEVVIVDNASTDSIEEVVSSYDDPRLRFIRNSENLGLFGNFNRCIELSRGDIIHILHSDDYIDEKFTETCVRFFNNHPNVSMTFTSAQIITSTGTTDVRYADNDVVFPAPDGFRKILEERCFIISLPSWKGRFTRWSENTAGVSALRRLLPVVEDHPRIRYSVCRCGRLLPSGRAL